MATRLAVRHSKAERDLIGTTKVGKTPKPHKVAVKRSKRARFKKINRAR